MTAFYRDAPAAPLPILRALSFQYLIEHKALCILPDELIVGERGPAPKATPTYPELCCHTLEDLDILDSREKISFAVDQGARDAYRDEVIPYWRGRSMRDRMFQETARRVEARLRGGRVHRVHGAARARPHGADGKIYEKGLGGLQADIDRALAALDDLRDLEAYDKRQQLQGHAHRRGRRHPLRRDGTPARPRASRRRRPTRPRKAELEQIAAICARVPEHPRAHVLGGAAGLLVRPPGRHHRAEHLGLVLPGPARPAPLPVLQARDRGRHADARAGEGTAAVLLGEVQQPAGAAEGRRDGGRERHLHRLRQHQQRRPEGRRQRRRQRRHRT